MGQGRYVDNFVHFSRPSSAYSRVIEARVGSVRVDFLDHQGTRQHGWRVSDPFLHHSGRQALTKDLWPQVAL